MAKRTKQKHAVKSFEDGISKHMVHLLGQQYDFIANLNQHLVELKIKKLGYYTEDIDKGMQQLGHLLAKGGLLSAQPEVIAAGELLVVVSALIRAFTKAWEDCKEKEKIKQFLFRCKCCLEIIEGVEKAKSQLDQYYKMPVSRQHVINTVSQSVAMSLSTRHHFAFQNHHNSLKESEYGTGRFYRLIYRAVIVRAKKMLDHARYDDKDLGEVCLHNSTLREFILHCALPGKEYKHFYHEKTFRYFSKYVDTKGKSIYLRRLFNDAAIIECRGDKFTIYTPNNGTMYKHVPPVIVNDINNAIGANRVLSHYHQNSKVTLKDLGVKESMLKQLPQSIDALNMAAQAYLICGGKVYRPKQYEGVKMETYSGRIPALHVARIPQHLQDKYIHDPSLKASDYRVWQTAKLDYKSGSAANAGFFGRVQQKVNEVAMSHVQRLVH